MFETIIVSLFWCGIKLHVKYQLLQGFLGPSWIHFSCIGSCSHWLVTASQGRATATGKWFKLAPRWFLDKNKLTDVFEYGSIEKFQVSQALWYDYRLSWCLYQSPMLLHLRSQVLEVFEWAPVLFSSTSSLSNVHVNEAWVRRLHSDLEPRPSTVSELPF